MQNQNTGKAMSDELGDDPDVLKARIEELQEQLKEKKKKAFWAVDTWQDAFKTVSVPIAVILAIITFWDSVVLRLIGRDSASVADVAANLEAIQDMDQELYVLRAGGSSVEANATEAAIIARRERMVAETFDHWRWNKSYFRSAELQILTHHLIAQNRTDDALKVFETYWPTVHTPFAKTGAKLLEARIFAQYGPIQNLDTARGLLDDAFVLSDKISVAADQVMMQGQLAYFGGIVELDRAESCADASPFIDKLETLAIEDATGVLEPSANEMRTKFNAKCEN
ncbi:MAG: hypothetical protein AAGA97_06130 [Pseudomonadota bacterium]